MDSVPAWWGEDLVWPACREMHGPGRFVTLETGEKQAQQVLLYTMVSGSTRRSSGGASCRTIVPRTVGDPYTSRKQPFLVPPQLSLEPVANVLYVL